MTETIIEIVLFVLILIALKNEDKLIAWERRVADKVLDFFAFCCACVIFCYRYTKWWASGVKR